MSSHPADDEHFFKIATSFAASLRAKAGLLDEPWFGGAAASRLRESLSDDLKKFCDIVHPAHRTRQVSVRASDAAAALGVDLCQTSWHRQPGFDPGRKVFHLEHVVPVLSLRTACLEATSVEAVRDILLTQVRTAWILKEEDRELTSLGHQRVRPDPDAAYVEAGIRLAPCRHGA